MYAMKTNPHSKAENTLLKLTVHLQIYKLIFPCKNYDFKSAGFKVWVGCLTLGHATLNRFTKTLSKV